MSRGYEEVKNSLKAGTPPDALCATCPWDRLCITPPTMTEQQIKDRISEAQAVDREVNAANPGQRSNPPIGTLLTVMTLAGKDTAGDMCPVFVIRLQGPDGRDLSDGVRLLMKGQ